jgi:single-stranded-DNA-specific exonuclease
MTARRSPKRWIIRQPNISQATELAAALGVSPIVAGLLCARGHQSLASAKAFLSPALDQLHDPFLMLGMTDAVKRLLSAIDNHEPVMIYGDYDVDGTTGTAVLLRALRMLGATAGYHVPHRFTEGYGIQQAGLEKAVSDGY